MGEAPDVRGTDIGGLLRSRSEGSTPTEERGVCEIGVFPVISDVDDKGLEDDEFCSARGPKSSSDSEIKAERLCRGTPEAKPSVCISSTFSGSASKTPSRSSEMVDFLWILAAGEVFVDE